MPPLLPILAIIIVVVVGGIGIIMQTLKIYFDFKHRSRQYRKK
jgi:hypothetical protein